MISLKLITKENLDEVLALRVAEGQERFVSSTAESLAQAYVYAETAYPFAQRGSKWKRRLQGNLR